ncbi:hypothetical protein EVAR_72364_1 [Eumeta japonica]|uniref:Uncharacterized protein n=1 Tax=Eumeta variegata TaxID=151549 RepID=A0A4C1SP76_EUMVA|nr:hypothetical protein EVAR_72364_1 [Eumeta japonica]
MAHDLYQAVSPLVEGHPASCDVQSVVATRKPFFPDGYPFYEKYKKFLLILLAICHVRYRVIGRKLRHVALATLAIGSRSNSTGLKRCNQKRPQN